MSTQQALEERGRKRKANDKSGKDHNVKRFKHDEAQAASTPKTPIRDAVGVSDTPSRSGRPSGQIVSAGGASERKKHREGNKERWTNAKKASRCQEEDGASGTGPLKRQEKKHDAQVEHTSRAQVSPVDGWRISEPVGGRFLPLDPVFSLNEEYAASNF